MAKKTSPQETASKASTRSKKRRVKNASKKGGTRVIPGSALFDIFKEKLPIALDFGKASPAFDDPELWLEYGDVRLEKKPSGLWAKDNIVRRPILILPTDVSLDDATLQGVISPYNQYAYYPKTKADIDVRATDDWRAPQNDAINALEMWQYRDATIVPGAQPDPEVLVVPPQEVSRDKSLDFSRKETRQIALTHSRPDLLPPGHRQNWTPEQVEAAQEAITDATGYEFGEHDPTFVAPVTEEGWVMLEDIFKEGVPAKRSSNPYPLRVTARMKKIAAQIDRQLAALPQNAILTDRKVEQILSALSS